MDAPLRGCCPASASDFGAQAFKFRPLDSRKSGQHQSNEFDRRTLLYMAVFALVGRFENPPDRRHVASCTKQRAKSVALPTKTHVRLPLERDARSFELTRELFAHGIFHFGEHARDIRKGIAAEIA